MIVAASPSFPVKPLLRAIVTFLKSGVASVEKDVRVFNRSNVSQMTYRAASYTSNWHINVQSNSTIWVLNVTIYITAQAHRRPKREPYTLICDKATIIRGLYK